MEVLIRSHQNETKENRLMTPLKERKLYLSVKFGIKVLSVYGYGNFGLKL